MRLQAFNGLASYGCGLIQDNFEVEETLRIRTTAVPTIPNSERYDINKVSADLIKVEEEAARKERLRFYSSILLCK